MEDKIKRDGKKIKDCGWMNVGGRLPRRGLVDVIHGLVSLQNVKVRAGGNEQ